MTYPLRFLPFVHSAGIIASHACRHRGISASAQHRAERRPARRSSTTQQALQLLEREQQLTAALQQAADAQQQQLTAALQQAQQQVRQSTEWYHTEAVRRELLAEEVAALKRIAHPLSARQLIGATHCSWLVLHSAFACMPCTPPRFAVCTKQSTCSTAHVPCGVHCGAGAGECTRHATRDIS